MPFSSGSSSCALVFAVGVWIAACSNGSSGSSSSSSGSSSSSSSGGDASAHEAGASSSSSSTSSSSGGTSSGDVDAGPVNGCSTFVDRTGDAASRVIQWDFQVYTRPEHCMKIKAGQTVQWSGDFSSYPLSPSGGDKPSPIADFDTQTGTVKFPSQGTFGYACTQAPAMTGAILVVP